MELICTSSSPIATSREALRIVCFHFNGRTAIPWEAKLWHLSLRKKWSPRFKFRLALSFLAPESGPGGIFKDFKIQYLCLGKLHVVKQSELSPRTFSPPPSEKKKTNKQTNKQNKNSVEKQGNILCFFKGLRTMRTKKNLL